MNAIIYTRFSPRRNADTSESCTTQKSLCEEYAKKKGYEITHVVHDPDVSGKDEYREKLWHAISLIGKGNVLLVFKRDRLARNVYLAEQINRAVESKGGAIEAVTGDVAGNGPEQTLMRQVVSSISEYERKIIGQRTRYAMKQHQKDGRRMGRYCPYGWEQDPADKARMIVNDNEQAVIDRIVAARDKGLTIGDIVRALNGNAELKAIARSGTWYVKTVAKILADR